MTFARVVFAGAFVMLLAGLAASQVLTSRMFGTGVPSGAEVASTGSGTSTTQPATPRPKVAAAPTRTTVSTPTSTPRPTPQGTTLPTPTPTSGVVTLNRYWVGNSALHPGQTVSIGYVIDNGTGRTERLLLGASIKSNRSLSWSTGTVNDPQHDVVAVVPPGVTTHIRYFTMPQRLRAGTYDVAWGLRDQVTGSRAALVIAPAALRVVH